MAMTPVLYQTSSRARQALELVQTHKRRMQNGIQLYAGSSLLSPTVELALVNSMGSMPAMGDAYCKQQPGTDEISALEVLVSQQLMDLFGGAWAEPRLQSCTYANAAVYAAFSQPGDAIAAISAQEGGHVSHHGEGTVGLLGRKSLPLVFSDGVYDDQASAQIIASERPRIVMLGASVMLDPYAVTHTVAAARDCKALLVYDASHVAGLIAGKVYQNPMDMGFDIMTASTYKTLSGPPGGILIGRDPRHHEILRRHIVGGWASNYDASRLAGLSIALEEAAIFMPDYAREMIATAQQLGSALGREGIDAVSSAMEGNSVASSNHLVIPFGTAELARRLSQLAGQAGLYVGTSSVPGRPSAGGLRIGTQVITRQGATARDLADIAAIFRRLLDEKVDDRMRDAVRDLAARLDSCLYCFEST
jgi:glycine hydroxymethyltransferase